MKTPRIVTALDHIDDDILTEAAQYRPARKKTFLWQPLAAAAACFILFVGTINLSPKAAAACQEIPLLGELTDLLLFRPSLRKAVQHDYVQAIDQEQTVNGICARIEYLIVDQKQVNIYYRLESPDYEQLSATPKVGDREGDHLPVSVSVRGIHEDSEELRELTVDFLQEDVPDALTLTLSVHDNDPVQEAEVPESSMSWTEAPAEPETIASFTFLLEFDPRFTAQGKKVELGKTIEVGGQELRLTDMEIYPTHIRLNVEETAENREKIQSLRFYLELDDGQKIWPIKNGITATSSLESPDVTSYRAESSYFEKAECIRLLITGADLLDKDRESIRLDLKTLEHDPLPEGVELNAVKREKNGWVLSLKVRDTEEDHAQVLSGTYHDGNGKELFINAYSSSMELHDDQTGEPVPGWKEESYFLECPEAEEVFLKLNYDRFWTPEEPLVVELD